MMIAPARGAIMKNRIHVVPIFLPSAVNERSGAWQPPIDIYRASDGWLLKVDLAGVDPADVIVELLSRSITIRGQRRDWCLEEGCRHFRMEISYSRFERTIELPDDMAGARVATDYRQGMLLIRISQRITA
jgi:HSP20 family protein